MREFTFDIDGDLARARKLQEQTGRQTAFAYPNIVVPPTNLVRDNFWIGEDLNTLLKRTEAHGNLASTFDARNPHQGTHVMVFSLLGGLVNPLQLEREYGDTTIRIPMLPGTEIPIGVLVAANFPAEVSIRNIIDGPFRRSISPLRQKMGHEELVTLGSNLSNFEKELIEEVGFHYPGFERNNIRFIGSTREETLARRSDSDIVEPLILSTARIYRGSRNNMDKFEVRFYERDDKNEVRTATAYKFEALPEVII